MSVFYVDVRRLLDESHEGQAAAAQLQQAFNKAKKEFDMLKALRDQKPAQAKATEDKMRQHEAKAMADIEGQRKKAREQLLNRAQPLLRELAASKKATSVLDVHHAIYVTPEVDLTDELLKRLNAK